MTTDGSGGPRVAGLGADCSPPGDMVERGTTVASGDREATDPRAATWPVMVLVPFEPSPPAPSASEATVAEDGYAGLTAFTPRVWRATAETAGERPRGRSGASEDGPASPAPPARRADLFPAPSEQSDPGRAPVHVAAADRVGPPPVGGAPIEPEQSNSAAGIAATGFRGTETEPVLIPPRTTSAASPTAVRAEPGASRLVAEGVSCWFGSRQVLENIDLVMQPGHVTALIGPSGCGKSTFLRTLNRMHELVPGASLSGSIKLDGQDIYRAGAPPTMTRSLIGMVFQRPNPFPAMTIEQNVLAGLRLSGRRDYRADELVEDCLRSAGLWTEVKDRLHSSGASLSGGQQQRLCIARALAVRPRVLLMDEPCSALDPISTAVIEETMAAVKAEVTIVIVTHNMQQASRVSEECALFLVEGEEDPGRIVEAGPTSMMFSNPRDSRTLDYISGRFG